MTIFPQSHQISDISYTTFLPLCVPLNIGPPKNPNLEAAHQIQREPFFTWSIEHAGCSIRKSDLEKLMRFGARTNAISFPIPVVKKFIFPIFVFLQNFSMALASLSSFVIQNYFWDDQFFVKTAFVEHSFTSNINYINNRGRVKILMSYFTWVGLILHNDMCLFVEICSFIIRVKKVTLISVGWNFSQESITWREN